MSPIKLTSLEEIFSSEKYLDKPKDKGPKDKGEELENKKQRI